MSTWSLSGSRAQFLAALSREQLIALKADVHGQPLREGSYEAKINFFFLFLSFFFLFSFSGVS